MWGWGFVGVAIGRDVRSHIDVCRHAFPRFAKHKASHSPEQRAPSERVQAVHESHPRTPFLASFRFSVSGGGLLLCSGASCNVAVARASVCVCFAYGVRSFTCFVCGVFHD